MTPAQAEEIAAQAMAFVTQDGARLHQFLITTGLDPTELRRALHEPGLLAAGLDYVAGDESTLLVFAAEAGLAPEAIGRARALLSRAEDA
jgi:hypothetical protein